MGIDPASCTLLVVAGVIVALAILKTAPDLILLGGLVLLMVLGVFPETSVALAGFANEGLLTVAVLFVVAEGMRQTGGLGVLGRSLLGQPGSLPMVQARLLLPVSLASASPDEEEARTRAERGPREVQDNARDDFLKGPKRSWKG